MAGEPNRGGREGRRGKRRVFIRVRSREKKIVVFGATYDVRNVLKAMGLRWNSRWRQWEGGEGVDTRALKEELEEKGVEVVEWRPKKKAGEKKASSKKPVEKEDYTEE